ncbi:hypothetical protein L6452_01488 [Arctium lappa]|uniref:Uncharacterized protein n=1 Tax=Arctium lappa TaxID=4217 RepID=A0ACB9FGX6_ARCLA|nr:hypothetical protein L6452_01488 [Arctium lappa]
MGWATFRATGVKFIGRTKKTAGKSIGGKGEEVTATKDRNMVFETRKPTFNRVKVGYWHMHVNRNLLCLNKEEKNLMSLTEERSQTCKPNIRQVKLPTVRDKSIQDQNEDMAG